ncbi:MAG: TlpA disulfide reductase family protein [candidate division WOR-3 bacterium]
MRKNIFILSSFVLVLFMIFSGCAPSNRTENTYLEKTWIETVNGDTLKLKNLTGKVVLIDFWATWCPPCRNSIPFLVQLYNKYEKDGLVIIGVNVNERFEQMKGFLEKENVTYRIGYMHQDLASLYQVSGIPTFVIFDKKGNLVKKQVGYDPALDIELENLIVEELKK